MIDGWFLVDNLGIRFWVDILPTGAGFLTCTNNQAGFFLPLSVNLPAMIRPLKTTLRWYTFGKVHEYPGSFLLGNPGGVPCK